MKWLLMLSAMLAVLLPVQPVMAQNVCPDDFQSFAGSSAPLTCTCSPDATARGAIYGMDVYTGDSSICQAAVHASAISAQGGTVTVSPLPGQPSYAGVTRNGITSYNWGAFPDSFAFAPSVAAPLPASVAPAPTRAQVCPDDFVAYRGTTAPLNCDCTAEATARGSVYGMDIYTDDSAICAAALHAGAIPAAGGMVTVVPASGQNAYAGVTRNGVSSSNWGAYPGSFTIAGVSAPTPVQIAPVNPASPAMPTDSGLAAICPDNFVAHRGRLEMLTCGCPASNTGIGHVYGTDIYTEDSGVCHSAIHAGVLTAAGGNVSVIAATGQASYPGSTRNGISSSNGRAMDGSFRFAPVAAPAPVAVLPAMAPAPATAPACPDDFVAYRRATTPLTCGCSAEAADPYGIGFAYGTDVYTEYSGICQAAVHAGYISPQGGNVTVVPLAGQSSYPGVTRNGITSSNAGHADGSFAFTAAQTFVATAPVQAPIGQTLAQTGAVDLYIHFAFNSAELHPDSLPVLEELRDVLRADPNLSLVLTGHTDSIGDAGYNLSLSLRRAESVKFWLVQNGILPSRLQAAGKGESEPIDSNDTEYGRAVNRRVEARQVS